jgi:hypothetical protein
MSLLLAAASAAESDNTVAVIAVVVSGVVGFLAPLIISVASGRRSARELAAAEDRQHAALAADRERLEMQLAAERERLAVSLEDARRAVWREEVRKVLDAGAVLLQKYRSSFSTIEVAIGAPRPVVLSVGEEWEATGNEVVAQRARLLLWFDEDEDLVQAFDEVAKLALFLFELHNGLQPEEREHAHLRPSLIETAEREFQEERLRYLRAARAVLA